MSSFRGSSSELSNELTRWIQEIGERQANIAAIFTDPDRDPAEAFRILTQSLALTLEADRVGIWILDAEQTGLVSCDVYDAATATHVGGVQLQDKIIADFIAKLRTKKGTVVEFLASDSIPIPVCNNTQHWPRAKIGLIASTNIAPPKTGFLTATRVRSDDPWLPEEIALARSAVSYLPIFFHAQENRQSMAKLKQSLSLLTGTLESTDEGIVATDLDRRITLANQRFMEIVGRPHESFQSVLGLTIRELLNHLTQDPARVRAEADRLYANPTLQSVDRIEYIDGRILERYSRPQRIEGEIVGRIFSYRDITSRERARKTRERLEAELRQSQKLEAIGTLAGGIAHDFNNILSGITCNLELLRGDLPPNHPAQESVREISQAARRASDLIRQILTFSRQAQPERKTIEVAPLVREALSLVRATTPKSIRIDARLQKSLPLIHADSTALHQVLLNLCTNARQAVGEKSGRVGISASAVRIDEKDPGKTGLPPGTYLKLSVQDSGCGMDKTTLAHLFEPFFTTKAPGAGTGLGLSVVHGIVRAHSGVIKVFSRPGRGTRFDLYFPEHRGEIETAAEDKPLPTGNGETILFVDDEPILVHVGGKILARLGYRPSVFQSAAEAVHALAQGPDICRAAFCDLSMPEMSGLELAAALHRIQPHLPIILVTGNQTEISEARLREAGITEMLLKPLSGAAIAEALARVLQK